MQRKGGVNIEGTNDGNIDYRENAKWKVYVYTNKINGKKYVGQTCRSLKERAGKDGKLYHQCKVFGAAILKYGWENFEPEIVADHLTREEANGFEKALIKALNTQNNKYGYNISAGGNDNTYATLDITGKKFGMWTALYLVDTPEGATGRHWMCRCDCGTMKIVKQANLTSGGSKSCGCLPKKEIIPNKYKVEEIGIRVYLNDEYSFIIDEENYKKINKYHWRYSKIQNRIFSTDMTATNINKLLFDIDIIPKKQIYIQHRNNNFFDFRKSNLYIEIPSGTNKNDWYEYLGHGSKTIIYDKRLYKKWVIKKNVVDNKQHSFFNLTDAKKFLKENGKEWI